MWEETFVALITCPTLEECRNLICTFSETGFLGCAHTNVQSKPHVVWQPPQKPNLKAVPQPCPRPLLKSCPLLLWVPLAQITQRCKGAARRSEPVLRMGWPFCGGVPIGVG